MGFAYSDRVIVAWSGTSSATPIILGSSVATLGGFAFAASQNGLVVGYHIENPDIKSEQEAGIATYSSGSNSLTVLYRFLPSLGGGPQAFSGGTKHVRNTPLSKLVSPNYATTNPAVTDDINSGYVQGLAKWLNTSTNTLFFCVKHAAGAAIWDELGAGGVSSNFNLATPEEFGGIGNGSTDDTTAMVNMCNDAIAGNRGIFLDPSKTYLVTSDLPAFTNGMVVIGGGTIKAPNNVRCLQHHPTGWSTGATEKAATGLSQVVWETQQTVTQVAMTNTAGIVKDQWVKVGSSTINTPVSPTGEINFWFEWAQVRAVTTNTSITLDRLLEGHRSGLLPDVHANYKVFPFPTTIRPVIVDVGFEADETASSIFATNLINRRLFFRDRGSIGARIRIRGTRWWETIAQLFGINSYVDLTWQAIPDVTDAAIASANRVFGYAVQCTSGSHACTAKLLGGQCRHAFTTTIQNLASYDATTPYALGVSFYCETDPSSIVSGASSAAYDTHSAFRACLYGNYVSSSEQVDSESFALAVNDRGFGTTIGVRATGPGYRTCQLLAAQTNWTGLGRNVTVLKNMEFPGGANRHISIEGTTYVDCEVIINDCVFQGSAVASIFIVAGYAGKIVLRNPHFSKWTDHAIVDDSGASARLVTIRGGSIEFAAGAKPPFRIGTNAVGGVPDTWTISGLSLIMPDANTPDGLFEVDSTGNLLVSINSLYYNQATLPLRSASLSTGGVVVDSSQTEYPGRGLRPVNDSSTSVNVGASTNGTSRTMTSATTITATLKANTPAGTFVHLLKGGAGAITALCEGPQAGGNGAGYFHPGDNTAGTKATASFSITGQHWFVCIGNADGDSAKFIKWGDDNLSDLLDADLNAQGFTISNVVLETVRLKTRDIVNGGAIAITDRGRTIYATAAGGTATVPATATLCPNAGDTFSCKVINNSGGTFTLDGPGATNIVLAANESVVLETRNGNAIRAYPSAAAVILS